MSKATHVQDARLRVSRRGFLKASGAGAALATGGVIGAVPFQASRAAAQSGWDAEHDVVVVGSGGAGFAAAISAQHLGADVVMLEKGAYVGGTTLVSGGTMWIPNNTPMREAGMTDDREDALRYMARYSFPADYDPDSETLGLTEHDFAMLSAFYDVGSEAMDVLQEAGANTWRLAINGFTGDVQADYMDHLPENKAPQGRSIVPQDEEGNPGGGGLLIENYQAHAERVGIPIMLNHRVERVILNDAGEVIGVEVAANDPAQQTSTPEANIEEQGPQVVATPELDATPEPPTAQVISIRARKGVIFASGGFVRNEDLMRHLVTTPYYGGCSAATNEGDFMRIANTLGAKLGNLHNTWRNEGLFEQVVASPTAYNCVWFYNGDSFLMVNRDGRRFVNEKRNYQDRAMAHFDWDANNAQWKNLLSFLVYDGRIQENWATGFPFPEDPETAPVVIQGNTLEELAAAIGERVEVLQSETGGFALTENFAANLVDEVATFNEYARTGEDPDFQRGEFLYDQETPFPPMVAEPTVTEWPSPDQPSKAMYPLRDSGPYYAVIVAASAVDTNGGPIINPDGQVVRFDGTPIVGLYGAGNCVASPGVNAYYGAGMTLGVAHAWGYAAARHAVSSEEKSA
ncbi:MAG TPA: FAD-binding protein [Thermomicrobiales bacterium]|jgi:hypothetical protein|nr:FAD-binding protein [Thermomicrobiales bacterium]